MKNYHFLCRLIFVVYISIFIYLPEVNSQTQQLDYKTFNGQVIDKDSEIGLASVHIEVLNSSIATITNNQGMFSLKVPENLTNAIIRFSVLGFETKKIHFDYFEERFTEIQLNQTTENLSEIQLFKATDAYALVEKTLAKRGENYFSDPTLLTAFYREIIKKRNTPVSLSEAVVKIEKESYETGKKDKISLYKGRKSTNYEKLDTIAFKLRGGPYSPLFLDVMKYPDFLFYNKKLDGYKFEISSQTTIDSRHTYIVDFIELNMYDNYFYGKLYIDAQSYSLIKAVYSLNTDNKDMAMERFVNEKPWNAEVYPTDTQYQVDYTQQDGKWYYSYGRASLEFVVNWKNKLFNSRYNLNSELVVTDREKSKINEKGLEKLKPSVVMSDDVSGFYDQDFWGENNIIEPDESIMQAIQKIKDKID